MGYRILCGLIAILACIMTGGATANPIDHDSGPQTRTEQPKPKDDPKPSELAAIQNQVERIARALEAASNKSPSAKEDERADRDLQAQVDMVRFASLMFWVGLAETLITVAGVFLVWRTLKATWDAVRQAGRAADAAHTTVIEAEKQSRRSLRAYVGIVSSSLEMDTYGLRAVLKVENRGQTPAFNVRGSGAIKAGLAYDPTWEDEIESFKTNAYVLPNGDFQFRIVESYDELTENFPEGSAGHTYVFGRIDYEDAFYESRWLTFRFEIIGGVREVSLGKGGLSPCEEGNDAN